MNIVDLSSWKLWLEEPGGESEKDWFTDPAHGDDPEPEDRWMFKPTRPERSPDEASAEYAASIIADLISVPSADVRLAVLNGQAGCISRNVIRTRGHSFSEGSAFLSGHVENFDPKDRKARGHSAENIVSVLTTLDPPDGSSPKLSAIEVFCDYLLFDGLIGNTDRHSNNWAIEVTLGKKNRLAPSFDHATAMGITSR